MFNKKEMDRVTEVDDLNGFIGKGMKVVGKLSFEGSVRIDGEFSGEVNSSGILLVGEGAKVDGEINVDTAVISGEIKGTINAKKKVELISPAKIEGDIKSPTLIIGEGVVFDGTCAMEKRPAELKPVVNAGAE
ncbi:MAG: polymer-forming cytoskeletal protein [Deltaproteobacteria bacterium]|nr:polymer-forming cytoskeletal protein [Deltaproteobacteria bacterium]